jgi:hypothetical protein
MIVLAALTSFAGVAGSTSYAGNAGASLGDCYNHVINACNINSAHPQDCAEAGMNACDEYHAANLPLEDLKISIRPVGNGKYKASFPNKPKPARETHERGEYPDTAQEDSGRPSRPSPKY